MRQVLQCHIYTAVERGGHTAPASTLLAEFGVPQGAGSFDDSTHVGIQDLDSSSAPEYLSALAVALELDHWPGLRQPLVR